MLQPQEKRASFLVLLLSGFIDYAGIAIVYPLFAYLLFDKNLNFLPTETSETMRGVWLGVLVALHPIMTFFSSPFFGALSDIRGRKNLLAITVALGVVGYFFAIIGVYQNSLLFLALYRIFVGISGGNCSIVSAIVADLSTSEEKAKNFGLLNMSFGVGFTIGPFLGGFFAHHYGYVVPFIIPFGLVFLNLILVLWKLKETRPARSSGNVGLMRGFTLLKRAGELKELKFIFLSILIFTFGWSFFTEFVPLFLMERFHFEPGHTGIYYGYTGIFYAISAGFLISPVIRRIGATNALFYSMLCSGAYLIILLLVTTTRGLWVYTPLSQFFLAFVYPTTSTVISNHVEPEAQGEVMGIYQSVNALALALSPIFSGGFIGTYPYLAVLGGGVIMAFAAIVFGTFHCLPKRVRSQP